MSDFYGGNALTFEYLNGSILSGGFNINSPAMTSIFSGGGLEDEDNEVDKDKDKNKVYSNFIIPIGLINLKDKHKNIFNILNSGDVLSHDIYDNLLNLVEINPKPLPNITKKNRPSKKTKTHKNTNFIHTN